jgi:hypothetical protein
MKKYLKGLDIISWLRKDAHSTQNSSIIWQNLMLSLSIIKCWLAWEIGTGQRIILGCDPFIGCLDYYHLSNSLLQKLNSQSIYLLAQATVIDSTEAHQQWMDARQLGLCIHTAWNGKSSLKISETVASD